MPFKDKTSPRSIALARSYRRKHYEKNKAQYYANNNLKYERMRDWLNNAKDVPCADCGLKYPPYVMDFDHTDPSKKLCNVGGSPRNGSWKKLMDEVAKCEVVCSNCHRERTLGKK